MKAADHVRFRSCAPRCRARAQDSRRTHIRIYMIDDRNHTYLIKWLPPEVNVILRRSRHASRDKMYHQPTKILPRVIITYGECSRGGGRRPGFEATYIRRRMFGERAGEQANWADRDPQAAKRPVEIFQKTGRAFSRKNRKHVKQR